VKEIQAQLDAARSVRAAVTQGQTKNKKEREEEDVELLSRTDRRGMCRPVVTGGPQVDTHVRQRRKKEKVRGDDD